MKILLCCGAGMSTSILVRKLKFLATGMQKAYVFKAMDLDSAEHHLQDYDVVLLGPQIRYALQKVKKLAEPYRIPVDVIDSKDYGRSNAEAILAFAEKLVRDVPFALSDAENKDQQTGGVKMNILLCCSAGMSTSLLVTKMEASAKAQGIDCNIWATGSSEVGNELEKADVLLLGPQVRYMLTQMKKDCGAKGIPVDAINPMHYGLCNGEEVLKQAISLIKEV